jgi:predicted regulator of Ras-like GTPase activity (Roadblock/LC7/MglB family)
MKQQLQMSKLKELLVDFAQVEGVNAAVVISRDGFVIEGETNGTWFDNETLGAVISVGIGSSAMIANELQVGEIGQTIFECAKGIVVVVFLGANALLTLVSDASINIGNLRYQLKKRVPGIEAAL